MPETEQNQPETTTAPEAVTINETESQLVESFDRDYVERLRRENASYRTKAKEAQEAAEAAKVAAEREKLDEVERLKAEAADAEKKIAEIEARAVAAERRAALTGKVADPEAALKLLDPDTHLTEDGTVNVEALLESYPFLAPSSTPGGKTPASGAGGTLKHAGPNPWAAETRNLTEQARILRESPALAKELQAAAKGR